MTINFQHPYYLPIKYLLLIMVLVPNLAWPATLRGSVDRNQITSNDMLQLQLQYDGRAASDQLDLSGLQADWEVLDIRPQSSSSIRIVNGIQTQETYTIWSITLAPRREGTLLIPPISVDGTDSNSISIQVSEQSSDAAAQQPIKVVISAEPENPILDQQIIVTVELSLLSSTQISNINGTPLEIDNAYVEQLAQEDLSKIDNGIEYQIVRWIYAVFPTQVGELTIPRQTFSGLIPARQRRGPFDVFGQRGQQVNARSESVTVNVVAAEEKPGAIWFPAEAVKIEAFWSDPARELRVGEPLTRTIKITALGQRAELIPPLPANDPTHSYKAYQDQPQLDTQIAASSLIGVRNESQAIVPTVAGPLSLPAQTINWWSTNTQSWEVAYLESSIVEVLPAAVSETTPIIELTDSTAITTESNNTVFGTQDRGNLVWKIAALALLGVTLVQAWFLYRRPTITISTKRLNEVAISQTERQAWNKLTKIIGSANAKQIRRAILNWSLAAYPNQPRHSIDQLAEKAKSIEFTQALQQLDRSIYSGGGAALDRNAINRGLQGLRKHAKTIQPERGSALPELYPTS
ncbi:MAG: BatD family protein [Arenicellaceae bacterium]|nr:BatD family protein [Arenicellaceae bacterium]